MKVSDSLAQAHGSALVDRLTAGRSRGHGAGASSREELLPRPTDSLRRHRGGDRSSADCRNRGRSQRQSGAISVPRPGWTVAAMKPGAT